LYKYKLVASRTKKTAPGQLHLSIGATPNSQRVQLTQNDSNEWLVKIHEPTQSQYFVSKCQQYIIVHGAGSNYAVLDLNDFTTYDNDIGAKIIQANQVLVKAHFNPEKVRNNWYVSTESGIVIVSSKKWNQAEESGELESRNITYRSDFKGIAFEEIMQTMHDETRDEIITKLNTSSSLSGEELLINEMTIEGHKQMSPVSAQQLAAYHQALGVKPKESIFAFLTRDTMLKMKEVYDKPTSPVQAFMFHLPGDGKNHDQID
jgi:hypothetical protein